MKKVKIKKPKPLSLREAVELYNILRLHLPEEIEEDSLRFIGTIIKNIRTSGRHRDYINAVALMERTPVSKLIKLSSKEVLELFIAGLSRNRIVSLISFCKDLRYG